MTTPLQATTPVYLSYNGFDFPSVETKTRIKATPIKDRSNRVITHTVYTLVAEFYVDGGVVLGNLFTTDTAMATIRTSIMEVGGTLTYNMGFGAVSVGLGGQTDVAYGPHPISLEYETMGGGLQAKATWVVEWHIKECADPVFNTISDLMSYTYNTRYSYDRIGYLTRTINIDATISASRAGVGDRIPAADVDDLRELLVPQCPQGFREENKSFDESEDKRTLRITVVHREMPENIPPENIADVQASHTVQTVGKFFNQYIHSIKATYTPEKGRPRSVILTRFSQLVLQRLTALRQNENFFFVPIRLVVDENIYAETPVAHCEFAYVETLQSPGTPQLSIVGALDHILSAGVFQPTGQDYGLWKASVPKIFSMTGNTGLRSQAQQDDIMIDLCLSEAPPISSNTTVILGTQGDLSSTLQLDVPPATQSFLHYESHVRLEYETNLVQLKPLPQLPVTLSTVSDPEGDDQSNVPDGGDGEDSGTIVNNIEDPGTVGTLAVIIDTPTDIDPLQIRTTPNLKVWLEGMAVRAGYLVNPPTVISVGGVPAYLADGGYFHQGEVANLGLTVVRAEWSLPYIVPGIGSDPVGVPINPYA